AVGVDVDEAGHDEAPAEAVPVLRPVPAADPGDPPVVDGEPPVVHLARGHDAEICERHAHAPHPSGSAAWPPREAVPGPLPRGAGARAGSRCVRVGLPGLYPFLPRRPAYSEIVGQSGRGADWRPATHG